MTHCSRRTHGDPERLRRTAVAAALIHAFVGTGLAAGALSASATAQAQAIGAESARAYDIPPGALATALNRFGQQSGVLLSYASDLTRDLQSRGLSGSYTPAGALSALLDGTGLEAVRQDGGYTLRQRPSGASRHDISTLASVTVTGKASWDLPEAYAGGQVATGSRLGILGNKDVLDTPFSTTSYTAQAIENQQARTLADVLSNDASIRNTSSTGHGMETFRVRGFDLWMGDLAFNGLYGLAPDAHVPLEMFERVEVLRGPSALLSGMAPQGSVGATVNLVPKRAPDAPLNRVTATYVGDAQFGAHADLARRFGEDKAWGVRVNAVRADGRTGVDGQSKTRTLGALGLDYDSGRVRASLDAYALEDQQDGGSVFMAGFTTAIPKPPDGDTNIYAGAENTVENRAIAGRLEYDLAKDWTVHAAAGRRLHRYTGTLRGTYVMVAPNGDFVGALRSGNGYSDTNTGEVGLRGNFQTGPVKHQLVLSATGLTSVAGIVNAVGANYDSNIYDPASPPPLGIPPRPPKYQEATLTSYAIADTLSFVDDRLQLTLGVREQRVRSKTFSTVTGAETANYDESAVTPAVGVVVKPWGPGVSLYANYIEGLSQGGTVTDVTASNYLQVFAPYKSKQMEAGVKWDAGRFLNTVSVFQITKPSLIRNPSTLVYTDDGEQRNRGIEWTTAGEAARGVRVLGGASYTHAVMTRNANAALDGNRAFGVPPWTANLGAEWDLPAVTGLTLTGRLTYTGKHYLDSANRLQAPSFTVADFGTRYATQIGARNVIVRAMVHNAFDRRYWIGGFADGGAQVGAGRQFLVSASVDF